MSVRIAVRRGLARVTTFASERSRASGEIELHDIIVNDVGIIPLVQIGQNVAYSKRLNPENFGWTPFEYQYWNIANGNEVAE